MSVEPLQRIPSTGAAIVSTPQDSPQRGRKAISMFTKLRTPVLGLVENMSGFECSTAATVRRSWQRRRAAIRGSARIPSWQRSLSRGYPHTSDEGDPSVQSMPESLSARAFLRSPRTAAQAAPSAWWSLHRSTGDSGDHAAIRERGAIL